MLGIVQPSDSTNPDEPLPVYFDADWDHRRDVVVLGGRGAGCTARSLLAQGVRRVVALLPPGSDDAGLPPAVGIAHSEKELWKRLIEFDPPPNTVTVRKIPNGGFPGDLHIQLADLIEKSVFNRATYVRKSEVWIRHFLRNFSRVAQWPSVGCLAQAFAGKACVVVSPGPSLAKNIDALRDIQDQVLIIASNRSVAPLCEAGIRPHLVVVSDPLDLRYQIPDKYLRQVGALVLDIVGYPGMFALNPARKFSYVGIPEIFPATYGQLDLSRQAKHSSLLVAGGSVATTAFRLGLELGCNKLLLVGQDLALSGDRYYIDTAPDGATRIELTNDRGVFRNYSNEMRSVMDELGEIKAHQSITQSFQQVKSWDGQGQVTTSAQFDLYRRYYESLLPTLPKTIDVFNCTEGGAHIAGAQHLPLVEVLAEISKDLGTDTPHPLSIIDRFADANHCPNLEAQVRDILCKMEMNLRLAIEAIEHCTAVAEEFSGPESFEKLDIAEAAMSVKLASVKFVSTICQPHLEAAQRAAANADNLQEALLASRELYSTFGEAARRIQPLVEQALREGSGTC